MLQSQWPPPEDSLQLEPCSVKPEAAPQPSSSDWSISLKYQGNGSPLVTAYTPWATPWRYVYPYTRQNQLFELHLENSGAQPLHLRLAEIRLQNGTELISPLKLEDFKRHWPATAVWDPETLLDRAAALGEITQTLFPEAPILPGTVRQGYLAFPRKALATGKPIQILIPTPDTHVETAPNKSFISFCWQPMIRS